MKALSNELSAFVMWIADSRFACHIVNMHRRPPRHLLNVDSNARYPAHFLLSVFVMKNVNADQ
jgi:hypothetical protein